MAAENCLPREFLLGPSPSVTKQIIDFESTVLPEYKDYYACVLDGVLSADECANLIKAAEAESNSEWSQAMVNVGYGRQEVDTETRSCGRIIWDNHDLASTIWARCQQYVPEILEIKDKPTITGSGSLLKGVTYRASRMNERLRFLRYRKDHYFRRKEYRKPFTIS